MSLDKTDSAIAWGADQGCQTCDPRGKCGRCKDFVLQCKCLVSEAGLQNLRENDRKVHFGLHLITFEDRLIKVWGPLIYNLACLNFFRLSLPRIESTNVNTARSNELV